MWVSVVIAITSVFLLHSANAQCNGTSLQINGGSGIIQSPNYPSEYGQVANCTWDFIQPTSGGDYLLELSVVTMRLYFEDFQGRKFCSGSYRLIIEGDEPNCTLLVLPSSPICKSFYNSPCNASQTTSCSKFTNPAYPVRVTYESDGIRFREQNVWGFRIQYRYIICSDTSTVPITPSTPDDSTTYSIAATIKTGEPTTEETSPEQTIGSFSEATPKTVEPRTTTTPASQTFLVPVIALSVIVGLLLLIFLVVIGIYCWRRRANRDANHSVRYNRTGDTPEGQYENSTLPRKQKKAPKIPPKPQSKGTVPPMAKPRVYANIPAITIEPSTSSGEENKGYERSDYDDSVQF